MQPVHITQDTPHWALVRSISQLLLVGHKKLFPPNFCRRCRRSGISAGSQKRAFAQHDAVSNPWENRGGECAVTANANLRSEVTGN